MGGDMSPLPAREPCPCGSQRSFGSCCAQQRRSELRAWHRVRAIEEHVVPRTIEYLRTVGGPALWRSALDDFFVGCTSDDSVRSAMPSFMRWCALTWVPTGRGDLDEADIEMLERWRGAPAAVTWLASTSPAVSADAHTFILAAARSPYSFLLIESVVPGWSLVVLDLLTGRRFRVVEPKVSAHVQCEDILFSAVLTTDGISTLLGCAARAIPSDWRIQIGQIREVDTEGAWLTRMGLLERVLEVCLAYREACDDDRVCELNTGGHPRELLLLRWHVTHSVAEMFDRLRSLAFSDDQTEVMDDETGPDGVPRLTLTWYEQPAPPATTECDALGFLYLDEGRLAAHVASRATATRLTSEIERRCGSASRHLETRATRPAPCGVDWSWLLYLLR